MAEEVCNPPALLDVALGIGLQGVHHVWELHAIPDEKHRDVVAHHVKVALPGVELDCKTTGVPKGFGAAALMDHGTEAHDHGGLSPGGTQEVCACQVADIMSDL